MPFRSSIVAGLTLIRQAIRSQNYVSGVSGWSINSNGSAEFNNITVRNGTTVSGTSLYYNGTPASGNLVASISSTAGIDTFGNQYLAGSCVYDTTNQIFAQLNAGSQIFGTMTAGVPNTSTAASIKSSTSSGVVQFNSPNTPSLTERAVMNLMCGSPGATLPQFNEPAVQIYDVTGSSIASLLISGAVIRTDLFGSALLWNSPSFGTGWSPGPAGGTVQGLTYRKTAEDYLFVNGSMHATSTTPASVAFTIPAGYRPKITQRMACVQNNANTASIHFLEINSNGNCSVIPNLTAASDVYINTIVPLGNVS